MEIELWVASVVPPKFASLPATVITPSLSVATDFMYLVAVLSVELAVQESANLVPMFASGDVETASETEVRQADAAKMTSEARARMV